MVSICMSEIGKRGKPACERPETPVARRVIAAIALETGFLICMQSLSKFQNGPYVWQP